MGLTKNIHKQSILKWNYPPVVQYIKGIVPQSRVAHHAPPLQPYLAKSVDGKLWGQHERLGLLSRQQSVHQLLALGTKTKEIYTVNLEIFVAKWRGGES